MEILDLGEVLWKPEADGDRLLVAESHVVAQEDDR